MTDPRAYGSGTEKALFSLSQGWCYFPGCTTPVLVFLEGRPVVNVHIAHIRGARPGSPRYDSSMTDADRAAFSNLILLCKPHHDLVDRLEPDRYPAGAISAWKTEREDESIEVLQGVRNLTEARLSEMIEHAVRAAGPHRKVAVEVSGGTLLDPQGLVTFPIRGWRELVELNRESLRGDLVVAVTARNTGHLLTHVDSLELKYVLNRTGKEFELALLGRNDYPYVNPPLPKALEVGQSATWLTALPTFEWIRSRAEGTDRRWEVASFYAIAHLGSGELVQSDRHLVADLPL